MGGGTTLGVPGKPEAAGLAESLRGLLWKQMGNLSGEKKWLIYIKFIIDKIETETPARYEAAKIKYIGPK